MRFRDRLDPRDAAGLERTEEIGSLAILSLMGSVPDMPDPARAREEIATLIGRLEAIS